MINVDTNVSMGTLILDLTVIILFYEWSYLKKTSVSLKLPFKNRFPIHKLEIYNHSFFLVSRRRGGPHPYHPGFRRPVL